MRKIILFFISLSISVICENLKIISLCPYITNNLILLGEEKNIVGLTLQDEEKYKKGKEIVGSMLELNVEKIISLKPDIVIASEEGNREENVRKLEKLGIKTFILPQLYSIEDIFKNFIKIAELINKKQKGEEIVKREKEKLKNLKFKEKKEKVFFVLGWKPLITTGNKTFINDIIEISGGKNLFSEIDKKWIQVNIEEVIKRNPDAIIYIEMGENFDQYLKILKDINAVKKNKIMKIEPYKIASPTPETIVDVCIKINKFLNEN